MDVFVVGHKQILELAKKIYQKMSAKEDDTNGIFFFVKALINLLEKAGPQMNLTWT